MAHDKPGWGEKPSPSDLNALVRVAEMMGASWSRAGLDVQHELRRHAPHWPGCPRMKTRLIAACQSGASRRDGSR
jgi:hypothetical protein